MRSIVSLVLAAGLVTSASAQIQQPVDIKSMLEGLKAIKEKQTKSVQSQLAQTITDFSNAAAGDGAALSFYMEATRVTQFVGRDHEQAAFRDWKKKEADKLNPQAIRTALRYTVMSLQRGAGATDKQMFPLVYAYAQDLAAILPSIQDQEILKQSVGGNIFARWYNIAGMLGNPERWEMAPGNLDSIWTSFLLPYMRTTKDPRILDYWDNKIAVETKRASQSTTDFATDRFNQTRRPELLWMRAEECVNIDMRDRGLGDMYNIVKSFPDHPKAGKWIDELQGLLTTPAVSGSAGTPASPAQ